MNTPVERITVRPQLLEDIFDSRESTNQQLTAMAFDSPLARRGQLRADLGEAAEDRARELLELAAE